MSNSISESAGYWGTIKKPKYNDDDNKLKEFIAKCRMPHCNEYMRLDSETNIRQVYVCTKYPTIHPICTWTILDDGQNDVDAYIDTINKP